MCLLPQGWDVGINWTGGITLCPKPDPRGESLKTELLTEENCQTRFRCTQGIWLSKRGWGENNRQRDNNSGTIHFLKLNFKNSMYSDMARKHPKDLEQMGVFLQIHGATSGLSPGWPWRTSRKAMQQRAGTRNGAKPLSKASWLWLLFAPWTQSNYSTL